MPTISEAESKSRLGALASLRFPIERLAVSAAEAVLAAETIGFPVVLKVSGDNIAHKTERGLVRVGLSTAEQVSQASSELLAKITPDDGDVSLLIAQMITGKRELIAGVVRDTNFGPTVMLGLGGIFAEAIPDVAFRMAPLTKADAIDMISSLQCQKLLGAFRGEPALDRDELAQMLVELGKYGLDHPEIVSIDCNPLIVNGAVPIIVDALIEIDAPVDLNAAARAAGGDSLEPITQSSKGSFSGFRSLFSPTGVVVVGASSHPGKFGFTALHNVKANGFAGPVFAINREGETILGEPSIKSIEEIPSGQADMAIICTPAATNQQILKSLAAKGIKAAFISSAGYREADEKGAVAELELVAVASELGVLIAGPNGQGLVSTPSQLCAQIVGPYPPQGGISIASQSGNLCSAFMNLACVNGVGVARAISVGNSAAVDAGDFAEFFSADPETKSILLYLENVGDGRSLSARLRTAALLKPVVVLKGGATELGQAAAASHTGALAAADKVFDGVLRQSGAQRATNVIDAYLTAATFATQPLPKGPRVAVLTSVGGWGVLTADAIANSPLQLAPLEESLKKLIDEKLPPRWSKSNPIDMAGGETRDTVPELIELVSSHPSIDAVIFLGSGVQSNTAKMLRNGPYFPDFGTERIVEFHERQDERFAQAAVDCSRKTGKPILVATEIAIADPQNPGPQTLRSNGVLCYPSADLAVTCLGRMWSYQQWLMGQNQK